MKKTTLFIRKHLLALFAVLVVVLSLTSFYFYKKSTATENAQATEIQTLVKQVTKIALVPTDEVPTLATVSDIQALKNQPFFADAIEGDKVLIYTNAKRAVLYRPSIDKIINIAPLNLGNQGQTQTP